MNSSFSDKKIAKNSIKENFDFANYDLRGSDFSEVNLTGANFGGALLGRSLITTRWSLLLQSVLLAAACYFVVYGNAFAAWFIEVQLKAFDIYSGINLFVILVIYALGFASAAFFSLKHQNWSLPVFFTVILVVAAIAAVKAEKRVEAINATIATSTAKTSDAEKTVLKTGDKTGAGARAVDGPAAIAGALVGAGLGTILVLVVVASIVAGSGADSKVRAIFVSVSVAGAGLSMWGFTLAIGDSISKGGFEQLNIARDMAETIAWSGAGAGFVFMLFGLFLGDRAIKEEEPELLFIRHFGVGLNALGSTKFANATLHNCNFSEVDLKHVRFKNAIFQGSNFRDAKNVHLASTRGTPLEFKRIRGLVVNRILFDKNFAGLNLQGLDFSYCDKGALRDTNFSNANISFANFTDCDLSNANLSEVNALATRFNGCTLTGACLEHWNIDSRTDLEGIICDFVYTNLNPKKRQPPAPNVNYEIGQFTKTYTKIADTIDFVVSNRPEFNALIRAVETASFEAGGEKIIVQNVEFKEDGSIVVKLKASPELDREEIYNKIRNEKINLQKKLELEKIKFKELENSNQTIQENIRHIVHDLSNLIKPVGDSLNKSFNALSQDETQLVQMAIEESSEYYQRAQTVFKKMKRKLQNDSGKIEYSCFDVRLLAEEVIEESMPFANGNNVKLRLSKKNGFNTIVNSDHYYLRFILFNLINNSIKYRDISKGNKAIVAIAIVSHDKTIRIDIIDNGIGIPLNKQKSIWEDGVRVNDSIDGSGFGLFFIQRKVNELNHHDGISNIKLINSKEGLGTRFSLKLPKFQDPDVDESAYVDLYGIYVLLVKNNALAEKSWGTLLETNGAECDIVNSMAELRSLLPTLERDPDVVVIDYSLPNDYCSVVDIISEFKKEFPNDIPTIVIADQNTDLSSALQGKTILRNPVEEKKLLIEINILGFA